PPLLYQSLTGVSCIFDEPIAIHVAKFIDPLQGPGDVWPKPLQKKPARSTVEVSPSQHDEQRGGVYASVIASEWHLAQCRHLAATHFVQNLTGFGIGNGIHYIGLGCGEKVEYSPGDVWIQPQRLQGRDNAVSAKYGAEPWNSSVGIIAFRI